MIEGGKRNERTPVTSVSHLDGASLLARIMKSTKDTGKEKHLKELIVEFLQQTIDGKICLNNDVKTAIEKRITEIDKLISGQVSKIIHAQSFHLLEASWRGLYYLLSSAETGPSLKVRILNVSKKDLLRDFERAVEFDQSALFNKVYSDEFDTFGGEPFAVLIGDYEISNHPLDISLLQHVSSIAAAAHAPFITAASAQLFGWETFADLIEVKDISKVFDRAEYSKWRSFRDSEDSRYVALCLPHVILRLPYGERSETARTFNFEESVHEALYKPHLLGNAAYSFATCLTTAFSKYGWCGAIYGEEGGRVMGLPTDTCKTDRGTVALNCPTELAISEEREKTLSALGFLSLVYSRKAGDGMFLTAQSCNKSPKYYTVTASEEAHMSARLEYIFAVSRFAHYIKAMTRDKSILKGPRRECENFLNDWIHRYVLLDDEAGPEIKARFPLREARIEMVDAPGKPGIYKAIVFLRPHFQLDRLKLPMRLVAELPLTAAG
jgi:type VI secretion system protein ImpC